MATEEEPTPIEIEYRSEGGPPKSEGIGYRHRWKATCPAVPEFRTCSSQQLKNVKATAIDELKQLGVPLITRVFHVIVDDDGERYRLA